MTLSLAFAELFGGGFIFFEQRIDVLTKVERFTVDSLINVSHIVFEFFHIREAICIILRLPYNIVLLIKLI